MQLLLRTDFTVFHYSAKPRKSPPHTLNRCGDGQFGAFLTPPPARPPETNRNKVDGSGGGAVCINHSQRFAHHYCASAPKLPPQSRNVYCILDYGMLRWSQWSSTKTTAALLLSQPWPSLCTRNSCPFRMVQFGYYIDAADRRTCNLSISINVSEFEHMFVIVSVAKK